MLRAMWYSLEEAGASLWRGRGSAALAIAANAAALFVLGALLLLTRNVGPLVGRWATAAEMSVYLRDDVTDADREAVEHLLDGSGLVRSYAYVPGAQAAERFRQEFPDLAGIIGDLADNPLPASVEVRVDPRPGQGRAIDALAARLQRAAGVDDVRYDRQWIERVVSALALVRGVGLIVVAILIVAAALTVATIARLATHARRDELEIMRLVGAPLAYVRGPFIVEGMLQGAAGAALALMLLGAGFLVGRAQYGSMIGDLLHGPTGRFLSLESCGLLLLGGLVVGGLGSSAGVAWRR